MEKHATAWFIPEPGIEIKGLGRLSPRPYLLVLDGQSEKMNIRRFRILPIITGFEVAVRSIERVSAKSFKVAIDSDLQQVARVFNLIAELGTNRDIAE